MQAIQATERIRPLRRVEYDKLVELGQFRGERIELLGGVLVHLSPVGTPHASTVQRLTTLLVRLFSHRAASVSYTRSAVFPNIGWSTW